MDPSEQARLAGAGVSCVLVLLGLVKCVQVLRRPTSAPLCLTALLLVLVAWLVSGLGNVAASLSDDSPIAAFVVGAALLLLLPAAFVLGIVGLVQFDRERYRQGRGQALSAVVLSGLSGVVI